MRGFYWSIDLLLSHWTNQTRDLSKFRDFPFVLIKIGGWRFLDGKSSWWWINLWLTQSLWKFWCHLKVYRQWLGVTFVAISQGEEGKPLWCWSFFVALPPLQCWLAPLQGVNIVIHLCLHVLRFFITLAHLLMFYFGHMTFQESHWLYISP